MFGDLFLLAKQSSITSTNQVIKAAKLEENYDDMKLPFKDKWQILQLVDNYNYLALYNEIKRRQNVDQNRNNSNESEIPSFIMNNNDELNEFEKNKNKKNKKKSKKKKKKSKDKSIFTKHKTLHISSFFGGNKIDKQDIKNELQNIKQIENQKEAELKSKKDALNTFKAQTMPNYNPKKRCLEHNNKLIDIWKFNPPKRLKTGLNINDKKEMDESDEDIMD